MHTLRRLDNFQYNYHSNQTKLTVLSLLSSYEIYLIALIIISLPGLVLVHTIAKSAIIISCINFVPSNAHWNSMLISSIIVHNRYTNKLLSGRGKP